MIVHSFSFPVELCRRCLFLGGKRDYTRDIWGKNLNHTTLFSAAKIIYNITTKLTYILSELTELI